MGEAICDGPGCELPAFAHSKCIGHLRQRQRGQPLRPLRERLSAWDRLADAAIDFGNLTTNDDDAFRRARANLRAAARAWARSSDGSRDECEQAKGEVAA